jgi:hypothetical protein
MPASLFMTLGFAAGAGKSSASGKVHGRDHIADLYAQYRTHPLAGVRDAASWAILGEAESFEEWAARQHWSAQE